MTSDEHAAQLWAMVAERAARRGARVGVADACAAAVEGAGVSGAGMTVLLEKAGSGRVVHATDEVSERIEELQLTCGEGPCMDALRSRRPVLTEDLQAADALRRWPLFAPAAYEAGTGAIYAFPMRVGTVPIGVLDLYNRQPRALSTSQVRDAAAWTDVATLLLLDAEDSSAQGSARDVADTSLNALEGYRAEIDQASGMVTVQLGVGIEEALLRLRAYAFAQNRRLAEVARDVVTRRLRFTPDTPPDPSPGPNPRGGPEQ
jgi:hypothetical protein